MTYRDIPTSLGAPKTSYIGRKQTTDENPNYHLITQSENKCRHS